MGWRGSIGGWRRSLRFAACKGRRLAVAVSILACLVLWSDFGGADDVAVPVPLQAELVAKIASYDKNFAARAGERAHILIVAKPGNADSSRFAKHMESALRDLATIGGLPHDEGILAYDGAPELAAACKSRRVSIVYLAPGFGDEVGNIRTALEGVNVLSVAAIGEQVQKGIVLGFDLVSGKPKILVQLTQAKKQDVAFKAEFLKLARVYE